MRSVLIWGGVAVAIAAPGIVAATSPLLAWRDPIYIIGCLAGVAALALLLLQPLLAGSYLPGLRDRRGRRVHAWGGGALVMAVTIHVAALWLTSPPDVIDALLLRSPTEFSTWGVIAMWAVVTAALLAFLRRRLRLKGWRRYHIALAVVIVVASVIHALLIDGTMGTITKVALCATILAVTARLVLALRLPADARRR